MERTLLAIAATMAAGSWSCSQGEHWKLELSSSANSVGGDSSKLEMHAGETMIVELMVVGAGSRNITFGTASLPSFATLRGSELKLSPGRADAGEYVLTLTATDGTDSQSAALDLVVQRQNTAPKWFGRADFVDDTSGQRTWSCPGIATCTAHGTARLQAWPCDAEGDGMTLDVEVVPRGEAFRKVPTHSASIAGVHSSTQGCPVLLSVPLTGLTPEQSYDFAMRVSDEFGAVANAQSSDGWSHTPDFGFDQGPCTTRQCACLPSNSFCGKDDESGCCSGICVTDPGHVVGFCQ